MFTEKIRNLKYIRFETQTHRKDASGERFQEGVTKLVRCESKETVKMVQTRVSKRRSNKFGTIRFNRSKRKL